ncbi:MAG: hypothetical protein M1133_05480 [Armatimonadetes bacterium]|nr:hypothetical protein [Armatimonadota bacterium]
MLENPDAKVVFLKGCDESIFQFHRCAARLRARGRVVNLGDQLTVYRVDSTVPEGPVMVTDSTEFVFSN